MYTTDILSFMPRAKAKAEVKPEEKSGSIAGKVVANYTKIAGGANPTRFKAINLAARAMFAILAIAPYAIATVGALFADAAFMTARGISNAYNAIRNRFSKAPEAPKAQEPARSIKEKFLDAANKAKGFAKEHPTFVKVAAATVATIGSAYLYKYMTHNNCAPFWTDKGGKCVDEMMDLYWAKCYKNEPTPTPTPTPTMWQSVKNNPIVTAFSGAVSATIVGIGLYSGYQNCQANEAAAKPRKPVRAE